MLNENDLMRLRNRADELEQRALRGGLRLGSDIDGVICNHYQRLISVLIEEKIDCVFPDHWTLMDSMQSIAAPPNVWQRLRDDKEFWIGMEVIEFLPFVPELYCTSRGFANAQEITRQWMVEKTIPLAPIHCIGDREGNRANKVPLLWAYDIDIFVEDDPKQWAEINRSGILCVSIDRPWNKSFDAGPFRIARLSEISLDSRGSFIIEVIREIEEQTTQAA